MTKEERIEHKVSRGVAYFINVSFKVAAAETKEENEEAQN